MRKVKTYRVLVYKLTCLFNVRAELFAQSRLQKVRRRVISHDCFAARAVNRKLCPVADFYAVARNKRAVMKHRSVVRFCCVVYFKYIRADRYCSRVAYLTAAFGIKTRFVKNKNSVLIRAYKLALFAVFCDADNFALAVCAAVARKRCLAALFKRERRAFPCFCAGVFSCFSCGILCIFKKLFKFFVVDGH